MPVTDEYLARLAQIESGGNPTARNPRSSATGLHQFIDSTWLDQVQRNAPDLLEGRTDEDVLALRTDPAISSRIARSFSEENARGLEAAGIEASPGALYLSHFLGLFGARKALAAEPSALVGDVLGADVVRANPFLAGKTVADMAAWANTKAGAADPDPDPGARDAPASNVFAGQGVVDTKMFYDDTQEVGDYDLVDQMAAAYLFDSPEVGAVRLAGQLSAEPPAVPGYDVEADLTPDELFHADDFAFVDSPAELKLTRERRAAEAEWREAYENGPLNPFVASTLAIVGSPSTWLSFGTGAMLSGGSVAARAARVALVTGAETAAGEAILQASQETRTMEESVAAILMGGTMGLGVGAVGARLSDAVVASAVKDAETILKAERFEATGEAVGAAPVRTYAPEDTELAPSFGVAEAVAKLPKVLQAPAIQLMTSTSPLVREAALRLVDVGMVTKGVLKGVAMPQAVEIAARGASQELMFGLSRGARLAFKEYRKAGGRFSRDEFYEAVGKAMRRDSGDPIVDKAAREIRDTIFDPLAKEAKARVPGFKMVPDNGGWRYLTRAYRGDRIAADLTTWKRVVADHFLSSKQAADAADAQHMADEVTNAILRMPEGRTDLVMAPPSLRGPTKERVFDIPDHLIEPWLESNIMAVAGRYIRSMTADIEFARAFPDVGNPMDPMKDWAPKIRDEAMAAAEAAEPGKRKAILDKADAEAETLGQLVSRIRGINPPQLKGVYGLNTTLKIGRDLSAMRALGSVVVSSLTDVARVQMTEGFARVYGTLLSDMVTGFRGIRMGLRDAQRIGGAVDLELNTRAQALFDVDATYTGQTKMEKAARMSGRATSAFMRSTGMPHWNTFWKGVASTVASTRLLRTAERLAAGKDISKFDRMRMAQSGLTDADMRAIAGEAAHWQTVGVNRLANINAWGNRAAAHKFRNALLRDIDDAVITPGHGDAPLWTGTDLGKTVFQFKRFGMASTHRTLISGLQRRDAQTVGAITSMLGLGAVTTILHDVVNHGEVKERTPRQLVGDAIDRTGLLSLYLELEALAPINTRPSSYAFDRPLTRFVGRGAISQAAGPTLGWFEDAAKVAGNFADGTLTQGDAHRARRLIPFQNHALVSSWLTKLEENSGLPEKSN